MPKAEKGATKQALSPHLSLWYYKERLLAEMSNAPLLPNTKHFFRNYLARNDLNFDVVNAALCEISSLVPPDRMLTIEAAMGSRAFGLDSLGHHKCEALTRITHIELSQLFNSCIAAPTPLLLNAEPLALEVLPPQLQGELYLTPAGQEHAALISGNSHDGTTSRPFGILTWRPERPNGRFSHLTIVDLERNDVQVISALDRPESVFADLMYEFSLLFPVEAWYCAEKRAAHFQAQWNQGVARWSNEASDSRAGERLRALAEAQICEASGDHEGVLERLRSWADELSGTGTAKVQLMRIVSLKRLNRLNEADAALTHFTNANPHYPMKPLVVGTMAWSDGDWLTVLLAYLDAINKDPQLQDLWPRLLEAKARLAEQNKLEIACSERRQALLDHLVDSNMPQVVSLP